MKDLQRVGQVCLTLLLGGVVFLFLDPLFGSLRPLSMVLALATAACTWFALSSLLAEPRETALGQLKGRKLDSQLADLIDMTATCLDAGIGPDLALQCSTREYAEVSPALCALVGQVQERWNAGEDRLEALSALPANAREGELASFLHTIIEASQHGTSVSETLEAQSEAIRSVSLQKTRAWARKVPVLIAVIYLIFLIPPLFLVLLGPSVLKAVRTLGPGLM